MEFHSRLQADKSASTHAIWIPGTVTKPLWHAAPRYQWRGVWKTMCSPLFITTYWHILLLMILVMHLDCAEPISIGCIPLSLSQTLYIYIYVALFWTPPILRQTSIPCSRSNNSHPSGSINVLGNFRSGYPRCERVATMSVAWPG